MGYVTVRWTVYLSPFCHEPHLLYPTRKERTLRTVASEIIQSEEIIPLGSAASSIHCGTSCPQVAHPKLPATKVHATISNLPSTRRATSQSDSSEPGAVDGANSGRVLIHHVA